MAVFKHAPLEFFLNKADLPFLFIDLHVFKIFVAVDKDQIKLKTTFAT